MTDKVKWTQYMLDEAARRTDDWLTDAAASNRHFGTMESLKSILKNTRAKFPQEPANACQLYVQGTGRSVEFDVISPILQVNLDALRWRLQDLGGVPTDEDGCHWNWPKERVY